MFVAGVIAALVSAASWALGSVLWRKVGGDLSAFSMNFIKAVIGCIYLLAAVLVVGAGEVDGRAVFYLAVSGIVGISIGDTFFFAALLNIGPRLTSLMGTLTPVLTALVAVAVLRERPGAAVWTGIILVCAGVAWVLAAKTYSEHIVRNRKKGVICGIMSVVCTVAGIILAKKALAEVSAIQASLLRMLFAAGGLLFWGAVTGSLRAWIRPLADVGLLTKISLITVLGTFGGFFLSLYALKLIDAAVASSLISTTPLFVIPIAAILLRERISARAVLGAGVAVGGVVLIFLGGR